VGGDRVDAPALTAARSLAWSGGIAADEVHGCARRRTAASLVVLDEQSLFSVGGLRRALPIDLARQRIYLPVAHKEN
jgi:hypothetical protein